MHGRNVKSKVYLSRRNLLTLLSKLDRKAAGGETECTIVKCDYTHPRFPQTMKAVEITAVEDEVYYIHRAPGEVHSLDIPSSARKRSSSPK